MASHKAPSVKAAVVARRVAGRNKTQIARELGITRNTVRAILTESDIDRELTSGRILCAELIPKAVSVVGDKLEDGSESAAFRLLEGVGVLGGDSAGVRMVFQDESRFQAVIAQFAPGALTPRDATPPDAPRDALREATPDAAPIATSYDAATPSLDDADHEPSSRDAGVVSSKRREAHKIFEPGDGS